MLTENGRALEREKFGSKVVASLWKPAPRGRLLPTQIVENIGAGDEIRTHDPNLGKVVLYP